MADDSVFTRDYAPKHTTHPEAPLGQVQRLPTRTTTATSPADLISDDIIVPIEKVYYGSGKPKRKISRAKIIYD